MKMTKNHTLFFWNDYEFCKYEHYLLIEKYFRIKLDLNSKLSITPIKTYFHILYFIVKINLDIKPREILVGVLCQ